MANVMRQFLYAALGVFLFVIPSRAGVWPTDYDPRYVHAVDVASQPLNSSEISYNLTTIGADDHIRNSSNQILMAMFTDYNETTSGTIGYTRAYNSTAWHPKLWTSVVPELQNFLTSNNVAPQNVSLRTKQLLGLPQDHKGYYVVEFWANTGSLFRPAMDDDITNPTTSLDFVGEMADTGNSRRKWFDTLKGYIYDPKAGTPYPWTCAGYTYDWGNTKTDVGLSEFIADNAQTATRDAITVRSVISAASYLYYVRDTESFNVTGWCDTIWMGSSYLPLNADGNVVYIHPGATMSGGEGITVTDLSSGTQSSNVTILNAGTIQGPSSGTRQSSVYFANTGGTVLNTGVITGDVVGVLGGASTRPITIVNGGTIRGSAYAIQTGGGDDVVTNYGVLDGKVFTGDGNDTVNVVSGSITGDIDGGAGTNTLNFNVTGGSTFTFNSNILEMATVYVNSGTVRLNGQVAGDVVVASGATLGGNCTLQNSLTNSGAVAPGNSIGTITVQGNYTQNAGGRLDIEVSKSAGGALTNDLLSVAGSASLAAGSAIELSCGPGSGGVFTTGDTFQIISAGALNNAAALTADSAFLTFSGTTAGGQCRTTLNRTAGFASAADTHNNLSMAAALDADAAAAVTGGHAGLLNQLMFTNAAAFNNSLHQLSPAAYLAVGDACDRTAQYMAESTGGYLRSRRAGQSNVGVLREASFDGDAMFAQAVGSPTELLGAVKYCGYERGYERTEMRLPDNVDYARSVWVNPFGVFYGEQTGGDHLGFQSNVAGVQLGIDRQFSENCIFGIGGGYDQMHIDGGDAASSGTTDTFRVGPYATWYDDDFYIDGSLTGGFHDNNVGRRAAVNSAAYSTAGSYRADDVSAYLGVGCDYCFGAATLSPLVSLQYIYYRQDDFVEAGADGATLAVAPRNANSLRSRVGGQLRREYRWGSARITSELLAGWAHEYLADDPLEAQFVGGVSPFSIDRGGVFRDAGFYGLNLTLQRRERAVLFTRYNGEYSSGGHFTAIDMGLMVAF